MKYVKTTISVGQGVVMGVHCLFNIWPIGYYVMWLCGYYINIFNHSQQGFIFNCFEMFFHEIILKGDAETGETVFPHIPLKMLKLREVLARVLLWVGTVFPSIKNVNVKDENKG